jgi:hypothetical protein
MDILGQPDDLKQDALKDQEDVVRPVLGDNRYRFLYGPVKYKTVFYPSIWVDQNTKEVKSIKHAVNVPQEGSIFDELAALDRTIRASMGEEKPKSVFFPATRFLYLGFNRAEPTPTVRIIEVKRTVMEGLIKLEDARSTKDQSKLRYGPIFTWDAIVKKTQDPSLPVQRGTKYGVEVDPEVAPFMGQVPVECLRDTVGVFFGKFDKTKVFTEKEIEAIHTSELDLKVFSKAMNNEEIMAEFLQYPIDLNAVTPDGTYVFPAPKDYVKKLQDAGIKFLEPVAPGTAPKVFPAPQLQAAQVVEETKASVIEAIASTTATPTPAFTPVTESPKQVPAPAPPKKAPSW